MPLTHRQTLGAGAIVSSGALSPYRAVMRRSGEQHLVRSELFDGTPGMLPLGPRRPVGCLAHMTDLHITDVQSPGRFEFVNREFLDPRFAELIPMQRPQEALTPHALGALIRSLNGEAAGPVTGAPLELVLTGGDAIDNGQHNEMRALLRLLDGGTVDPNSGAPRYEGVQSVAWPDDIFWIPDGRPEAPDMFQRDFGYPVATGLLERAIRPFDSPGLRVPWLGCHGNHDGLCRGVGRMTADLRTALVGGRKPIALPDGLDRDRALETFITRPEAFLAGPTVDVTADPGRRHCTLADFITAHIDGTGSGHGFDDRNLRDGTAYLVRDTAAVRVVVLDLACPAGSAEGCMDAEQMLWLERRLTEVHSSYRDTQGRTVRTQAGDRIVVVVSHHGSETVTSVRRHADGSTPTAGGRLLSTLLRFDNVVLWLNGHTHTHAIRPRRDPAGAGRGLWEVTTASLVDWPCQARSIELVDMGDGALAIASTMIDYDGPADPGGAETPLEMASLHRQLAANMPGAGFGSRLEGTPLDRNVIMMRRLGFTPR
ncbi:MAG: TIGR03767 family metallophosphoesterase [Candidatus Dormibacteria bacterium]|jgi:metallophosphoesterase (TIGR03767 family)